MTRIIAKIFLFGVVVLGAGAVFGQNYPNKPIRIVTASVGAGSDFLARVIAAEISGSLGQPVIVENRPSGVIPFEIVARALPDGYTLLVYTNAVWNTAMIRKVTYDPVKDYTPITLATRSPILLVVHPSLPVTSVQELIALARAKPGQLNASTGSTGGSGHLALELFKSLTGVNILRVPYSSGSTEVADLLGGRMQMTFGPAVEMSPHVKAGKMRALAVTTAQPSALFPELPTMAAAGVPGYEWVIASAVLAPGNTPAAIINRLNRDIVQGLSEANVKQRILDSGAEVVASSPEVIAATIKSDLARLGKLVKDAGIKEN